MIRTSNDPIRTADCAPFVVVVDRAGRGTTLSITTERDATGAAGGSAAALCALG